MIEKLYIQYYDLILRYCISMTGSQAQAEDITQDTFLRAMEHMELLEDMADYKCRSWLYTTAKHLFIDRFRRQKNAPELPDAGIWEDDLSEIMVQQLCANLTPEERTMFRMRYMEGYNASEIGEIYDQPSSTVRAKLAHARKEIAKQYAKDH